MSDNSNKTVTVMVSGTAHRIVCPASEADNIEKNAEVLNKSIIKLREMFKGKNPSNETLLVLHCFDLYDQITELKTTQKFTNDKEQRANVALDQLLKTAKGMIR